MQADMKQEKSLNEEEIKGEHTPATEGASQETAAGETTPAEEGQAETPKTDAEKLAEAEDKIAEFKDKYLRQVAEFDNYRKRTLKEKAELILNGAEKTVVAILPVLDDFERALQNMAKAEDVAAVKEGVDLIYQKFIKTLEAQGVKTIDTKDADFNTDLHEAIAQIPAPTPEMKGKVIDCVQTGYTLNDKVIRHAKVAVGL